MATLPQAPLRKDFEDQESFEEAMGFWQQRVGRIKGMAARQTAASEDSPAKSDNSPPATSNPPKM